MIKLLKKLFNKKETSDNVEINNTPEVEEIFTPSNDIEIFLLSHGFTYKNGFLSRKNDKSTVNYEINNGRLVIIRQGGNITLNHGNNLSKIERFLKKYFI